MSKEHAMRFPLVGSAMLLSLFLLFKFLSKDLVNAVLTAYFFILGIVALSYVQIFSEYLCRHVYLWANDCIHSLVQGNIASIYKTFSSKRMEWQSHCMAGSIYPLYEPHSLWCSFLFVQLCRSWNKLLLCFHFSMISRSSIWLYIQCCCNWNKNCGDWESIYKLIVAWMILNFFTIDVFNLVTNKMTLLHVDMAIFLWN